MSKQKKDSQKELIVTDKQLAVIRDACELYGRIQIGQFRGIAEIITQTGFCGWELRVQPKKNKGETDEQYKARCDRLEEKDMLVCDCIKGALEGIFREVYHFEGKPRTNEADVALDVWAVLDGRRGDIDFHMGSEPLVKVKDLENSDE